MSEAVVEHDHYTLSTSECVEIYRTLLLSRAIDHIEESELVPGA